MNLSDIRLATPDDFDSLGEVMFDAVRNGSSPYSDAQRLAWVPEPRRGQEWITRLSAQTIYVAEKDNQIIGFMSLADRGYIDFAYISPSGQGSGIFRMLYNKIENLAMTNRVDRLWVHASLSAQPAFGAMGFQIVTHEEVEIGGQTLQRFEMEKPLK